MRRAGRSDVDTLLQEARGLELLASEAEIPVERVQEYWAISADLVTLVMDIEAYLDAHPQATYEDTEMVDLRRRLRNVASRLSELTPHQSGSLHGWTKRRPAGARSRRKGSSSVGVRRLRKARGKPPSRLPI